MSGSLRQGSSNAATLATARSLDLPGIATQFYENLKELPRFSPDDEGLHPQIAALRSTLEQADALLICTPEYAGTIPGVLKEFFEWAIGGGELDGKPIGWVNISAGPTGALGAHQELARVVAYAGAREIPGTRVAFPVERRMIGEEGQIDDAGLRDLLSQVLRALSQG